MSNDENRLQKESEEVQHCFANHPHVSIVSTEGTPVNKYIVEYRVNGLVRLDDGEIAKSDQHRVEISLSFGFPHFPPNCRPLTQIFHPDIDPSAIKIADFWSVDETLAGLIVYIGRMICWQVCSEENYFNQDAATWLAANRDTVPLDDIDFAALAGQEGDAAEQVPALGGDVMEGELGLSAEDLPELAFESVDLGESSAEASMESDEVADVARDLDFGFTPPPFSEKAEEEVEIVVEEIDISAGTQALETTIDDVEGEIDLDFATVDVDYDILRGMMDQRNFFSAHRKLNVTPPENLSQASHDLREEIESSVNRAERVFQQATELEHQGQLEDAALKFEEVLNIARDFPELEVNMKRVRNAWMATMGEDVADQSASDAVEPTAAGAEVADIGELTLSLERDEEGQEVVPAFLQPQITDTLQAEPPLSRAAPSDAAARKVSAAADKPARKKTTTTLSPSRPASKSRKPLAFGIVLLLLALVGWVYMEWSSFNKARQQWATIPVLLEQGEFQKVNEKAAEVLALLDRVHVVMASGKKRLVAQVQDIIGTEHFQEALEGKVYYRDQYISARSHAAYLAIEKHVSEGEKKGAVSDWPGALVSYEAAQQVAEENKSRLDETFYDTIVFKVKQAQFANYVTQGKSAFIAKNWPVAIENFDRAMTLAKTRDITEPSTIYDINRFLQRARFAQFIADGDEFLKKGDLKEAVASYQGAYDIAAKTEVIDKAGLSAATLKLHQTTLMKGITEGDSHAKAKRWKQAVAEYERAEYVLPYDVTIPGKSKSETQDRVAGSLLNALHNREQELAQKAFVDREYDKAVEALNRIIRAIESSHLRDQAQWQLIKKQAEADLKKAGLQALVEEKTAYLLENYKGIFVENFVGVRATALDQPQVTFLESNSTTLVFRMRCRENRDLKYFTLELIYQYDLTRDTWGFPGD